MKLILHTPDSDSNLSHYYQIAFKEAIELIIVTAYLTEWDVSLKLNQNCRRFRVIIGKDFWDYSESSLRSFNALVATKAKRPVYGGRWD